MIIELPNFLTEDQINFINLFISKESKPENFSEKIGSYRQGKTVFISKQFNFLNLDKFLFENVFGAKKFLDTVVEQYNPAFQFGDSGYEFHRYEAGHICEKHSDVEAPFDHQNQPSVFLRFASIVLHLNTPKDGGELIFPLLNKSVKTEAGKVVIFPPYGFAEHYTAPSTERRDVIVTWLVYNDLVVNKR